MKQLIARLRQLEAAATPRYTFDGYDIRATRYRAHHVVAQGVNLGSGGKEACTHLVEAANALPQLLDRLEALERVVDTIEWCQAVDEPVSEFILKEIRAIGRGLDYVE